MEEREVAPFGILLTRAFFKRGIPVTFSRDEVIKQISICREDKGYPMFRQGMLEKGQALMVCWAGYGKAPNMISFHGVPEEDRERIRIGLGDWIYFVEKYGTPEEKADLLRKPFKVWIKGTLIGVNE